MKSTMLPLTLRRTLPRLSRLSGISTTPANPARSFVRTKLLTWRRRRERSVQAMLMPQKIPMLTAAIATIVGSTPIAVKTNPVNPKKQLPKVQNLKLASRGNSGKRGRGGRTRRLRCGASPGSTNAKSTSSSTSASISRSTSGSAISAPSRPPTAARKTKTPPTAKQSQ